MKPNLTSNIPELIHKLRVNSMNHYDYLAFLEDHFNKIEPKILAFLPENKRFNRLQSDFDRLKNEYTKPKQRSPLYGLVIGVKDIFHVDGFQTCAGSKLPPHRLAGIEAKSVTILKDLGALILGKTVTTEFAYFAPGPTRNPQNYSHTPGGSSSGSAAAVAAGLVAFAFGTQTIGSIIRPASYCGVIGFKPTYGRISAEGVIPLAPSVDTIGFFTRDVSSTIFMAAFLCQGWQEADQSQSPPVLAVPEGPYIQNANPEMLSHFNCSLEKLANAGYQVIKIPAMPDFHEIDLRHNTLVAAEAAKTHETLFAEFGRLYHPKTSELIQRGKQVTSEDYQIALKSRGQLRLELSQLMEEHGIDLWLSPAAQGVAPRGLESTGNPIMNMPWTHCGFPTVNIPIGKNRGGLPIGLQVSAGTGQDENLLAWSLGLESVFSGRNGLV